MQLYQTNYKSYRKSKKEDYIQDPMIISNNLVETINYFLVEDLQFIIIDIRSLKIIYIITDSPNIVKWRHKIPYCQS